MSLIIHSILTLSIIANIALIFCLSQQRYSQLRTLFAIHVAGIAVWTAFVLFVVLFHTPWLLHSVFVTAAILLIFGFLFVRRFTHEGEPLDWRDALIAAIGALFAIVGAIPGGVFESFTIHNNSYAKIENGFASGAYSLFVIAYIALPVLTLFLGFLRSAKKSARRAHLRILFFGFLLFLGMNMFTNSVLPVFFGIYFFNAIGPVFSLILAAFVFYIIWRHEFLDIKIIIQRGLVYLALSAPLAAAYFGLNFGLESLFLLSPHTNALLSAFVTLSVAALAMYAVERYFEKARLLKKEKEYAALLEREVAERTKHLKELQEYQRRMMDDISHAIQTPVTVIRSAMESVHHGTPYEKTYQTVEKNVDDLSRLARDFLHLSKLESLPDIAHERFSLSNTIAEIAEYAGVVCKESGITLRQSIERDIPIHADKSHIEELVRNLLSNAIKYTKDSKRRDILVVLRRTTEHVEIRIEDTGIGISQDALPRIFERFFRANGSPHGVGLGLSICKRIAELHGGTITAKSIEGKGSAFIVILPLA